MSTKYPIILVHGILFKDLWHRKAFGKIGKVLTNEGHKVFTSNHDGLGAIETNAEQIKEYVNRVLLETGAEKVNIIAHSKGGLDSLYMIDRLGMSDKVASATFLCTPHKGSAIAERLYDLPKFIRGFIAFNLNLWYRILGDKHPNSLEVCRQLKTNHDGVVELDGEHDGIFMQSYSTVLERKRDDFLLGIPLIFSRKHEGHLTDGLVSVESSKFKNYRGHCTDSSISHSQMVDFMTSKRKKEKVYKFYIELCSELEEMGF